MWFSVHLFCSYWGNRITFLLSTNQWQKVEQSWGGVSCKMFQNMEKFHLFFSKRDAGALMSVARKSAFAPVQCLWRFTRCHLTQTKFLWQVNLTNSKPIGGRAEHMKGCGKMKLYALNNEHINNSKLLLMLCFLQFI